MIQLPVWVFIPVAVVWACSLYIAVLLDRYRTDPTRKLNPLAQDCRACGHTTVILDDDGDPEFCTTCNMHY